MSTVKRHVPRYNFACVRGHPAHNRSQSAFCHSLQFIEWLTGLNAVDQVDMFLFVWIFVTGLFLIFGIMQTSFFAVRIEVNVVLFIAGLDNAFRSDDHFGHVARAVEMTAETGCLKTPCELIFDSEMIKDMSDIFRIPVGSSLVPAHTAACAYCTDRMLSRVPIDDVQVVHVLLNNVVTAKPEEVVPVAELIFDVGDLATKASFNFRSRVKPDSIAVPGTAAAKHFTNSAVGNEFVDFEIRFLVPSLCANSHGKILFFGFINETEDFSDAGRVDRH